MFDQEFAQFLGQLGVGGAIAGLLFFFYRKDVRAYTDLWKEQAALNQAQTNAMMMLVEKNSSTISQNTEVLKQLHRRIDRLGILRFVEDGATPNNERER